MIGLDAKIETLRAKFESNLFTSTTYVSYGRAFWNKEKDESVPELQLVDSIDYQNVLLDDKVDGHSFILPEPDVIFEGAIATATVGVYFAVNLDELYSVSERAVEYLHRDVVEQITDSGFKVTGWVMGLEAFDRFGFIKNMDNMEPFYLVRFDTEVEYNLTCTN